MPELPEVEVVRLSLQPRLLERRFREVEVRSPALREPLDRPTLMDLSGRRVTSLKRRAKYLLIEVEGDRSLVVHLGMSGHLTVVSGSLPRVPHEHLSLGLDDGCRLRLVDPRRFGLAFVLPTANIEQDRHFAHLGVEPLAGELTGAYLKQRAAGRRGPVKTFLMDGTVVVGVGNIYASEVLWRSKVHPKRSVSRISMATWNRLSESIQVVLARAIAEGGTTLSDFRDGEGNTGYFQVSLSAYGREDEPCSRCGTHLRRIVQANRSTFYCHQCQR